MRQDAAFKEGIELVLDEPGQRRFGAGIGVGDEAGRELLHQVVQRGLSGQWRSWLTEAPYGALCAAQGY